MTKYRILFSWNLPKSKQQLKFKTMTNAEKAMQNGLWVGKKVWDCTRKESKGVVAQISAYITDAFPVLVIFSDNKKFCYTVDRRWGPIAIVPFRTNPTPSPLRSTSPRGGDPKSGKWPFSGTKRERLGWPNASSVSRKADSSFATPAPCTVRPGPSHST